MNKIILSLLLLLNLSGCAYLKEQLCDKPIVPPEKVIQVDPKLLEPCKPLQEMISTQPTFEDYLLLAGTNATLYAECKKKHENNIVFIKDIANIK